MTRRLAWSLPPPSLTKQQVNTATDGSGKPLSGSVVIVTWGPAIASVIDTIRAQHPNLNVAHFCLQTSSQQLLEESRSVPPGVGPDRYIFTELLKLSPRFDEETIRAHHLLSKLLREATIYSSLSLLPPEKSQMPNVKLIHILSAGVDTILDHPLYHDDDIQFTSSRGIHGVPIGEWVMMTVLAFRKNFASAYNLQQKHEWPSSKSMFSNTPDLQGCKVGILGYGSIGRQVARLLSAFGCTIIAYTASPRPDAESRKDSSYVIPGTGDPSGTIPSEWFSGKDKTSLHNFLSQNLDCLVLSLALTPSTTNLISQKELDVLDSNPGVKNKCYLINVSRGKIVDQKALVSSLNDEKLAGAALDVTSPEPLPSDSSLWDAKNVTITPHISALGPDIFHRAFDVLITNLNRLAQGQKLLNLIDKEKGY